MNFRVEENRVKLHVLHSLARSQRALARMIEQMADVVEASGPTAGRLAEQIDAISRYQRVIAVKMLGVRIRKIRRGAPGKLWLQKGMKRLG
ncbi:hypothetical protein LJK88_11785 [Paenibacillus sp. P26]|nr:hypothetical protein LJK88_11785 [Paenibacillus sp. P26]UUZ89543.1 hypothetical protein LJK87_25905 [Paenibacillus sp. P25]